MKKMILLLMVGLIVLSACEAKTVEVIRTVEVPVITVIVAEVTREVPVETIKTVEIIKTIEVEVEKIVTQVVTQEITKEVIVTPTPKGTTSQTQTTEANELPWVFEDVGEITSKDVTMKIKGIVCFDKKTADSLPNLTWPSDVEELADAPYVCAFFTEITNNSKEPITYNFSDTYFVMGNSQSMLSDCLSCVDGIEPFDAIQPGVTAESNFLMPFTRLPEKFPMRVLITLGRMFNPNTYRSVTGYMTVEENVP